MLCRDGGRSCEGADAHHADETLVSVSSQDLLLQLSDSSLQSLHGGGRGLLLRYPGAEEETRETEKGLFRCDTKRQTGSCGTVSNSTPATPDKVKSGCIYTRSHAVLQKTTRSRLMSLPIKWLSLSCKQIIPFTFPGHVIK